MLGKRKLGHRKVAQMADGRVDFKSSRLNSAGAGGTGP